MLRSLRALPQTDGAHPASVDTLLTRIVGFTGKLDLELKKLTAQQVIDMTRSKPDIMPPEWAQDLVRKPTPETQLTARYRDSNHHDTPSNYSGQLTQYPIQPIHFPIIPPPNPFLLTVNPPQTQMSESRLPNNETGREQQSSSQPSQQMEQVATETVKRPRQSTTSIRSVHNMLIPPIPAYPQQQTPRIPLLPYTTERNQQQRQSQRSISPPHKRADESEDENFLDEIIPGMKMPHLPSHMSDIETAQRTWQHRGYELVRDLSVIKYKNSQWHSKLAIQMLFTFRDWREFCSDAGFLLEQINIPHYLSKEYKSQSPHEKSKRNESIRIYEQEKQYAIDNGKGLKICASNLGLFNPFPLGRDQMNRSSRQKRERNRIVAAAVAVAVVAKKYKKIGQGKETRQFLEPMEMKTANPNIDLNYKSPQHNTPNKPSSTYPQQYSSIPPQKETLAILKTISPRDPRGYKERELESKQLKLQQYAGLMDVIERFHEIMKPIIEEEKKKPKTMLPGYTNITRTRMALISSIHLRTIAQHQFSDRKIQTSQKNSVSNLMWTYARAQSPIVFDQPITLKNG
ncbi:MAG: hypothetical protein EZS28_035059 [Streblomastix strix]|uniref:Uncharacterized protein n=1 Tax=Streblomastix strix TaxID=222440 RepID=A0A5J4UIL7_9EUKA|nr:MAG: hypothetical protein EZS28_035059 [Streblomastix strix]